MKWSAFFFFEYPFLLPITTVQPYFVFFFHVTIMLGMSDIVEVEQRIVHVFSPIELQAFGFIFLGPGLLV